MAKILYWATSLTGGGTGALDSIVDGDDLADLDGAVVITASNIYTYSLDADSGLTESSPDIISPDANAGDKRWILTSVDSKVIARRLDNLCRNAAFASRSGGTSVKPDEWALEGSPTIAYDTVDLGYGDHAVKPTATGAGNEGIKQTLTHLKPSAKYQVFVRAKATDGDTARLLTTGATTNIDTETTSTSWVSLTGEFVTDASATDVVIKLLAKADGDIVWFCGITCVEGDIPPGNFIRRVNETIYLTTLLTDAAWDGDSKSDADSGILDLSAFGNGCPPKIKAVLVNVIAKDSASIGNLCFAYMGPNIDSPTALTIDLLDLPNDRWISANGVCPCDSNGDVYVTIDASGANTLDIHIQIYGYVLGE